MNRYFLCLIAAIAIPSTIYAQLTIILDSVPSNTPLNAPVYMAGTFNAWNPGDSNTIFQRQADSTYHLTLNINPGSIQYKFTRGSWSSVEGNSQGQYIPNRSLNFQAGDSVHQYIAGWEDLGAGNPVHTADSNVYIITDSFFMPQLKRYRRIWIYLPPDYDSVQSTYPVLYMQDGQNLFDAATSFAGEWEVDESLNSLFVQGDSGIIVVGIDNGAGLRLDEYSPWVNTTYGGGEGEQYMAFIVNTLKPFIDSAYRTMPDRENTGIMGSSMGGLISLYGALKYQQVFSKAGIFSPSLWFSDSLYSFAHSQGKQADIRFYFMAGPNESSSIVAAIQQMKDSLVQAGFSDIKLLFPADGQHSEWFWKREFPAAYQYLFRGIGLGLIKNNSAKDALIIYPNPAGDQIFITGLEAYPDSVFTIRIFNIQGEIVMIQKITRDSVRLDVSTLANAYYFLQLDSSDGMLSGRFKIER